jgi:hypothetical protein
MIRRLLAWGDNRARPIAIVILVICAYGVVGAMDEADARRAEAERAPTQFVHGGPEWEPCADTLPFKKAFTLRDIRSLCTDEWVPASKIVDSGERP